MSKFLKTIVNIILILAVIVAGGLLIPPMAGVTTVIVDDVYMNTNLKQGSVTYAVDAEKGFAAGDKVLISEDGTKYVYSITDVDGETYTLEDTLSVDGGTQQRELGRSAKKVLFTIPFVGFVSMALGTTEGLIIVGLGILFVIILFILSEIWKKDEDDDEEDEKDVYAGSEDEQPLSRKEEKKAAKQAKKEEKKAAKQAKKEAKRSGKQEDEEKYQAMYAAVDLEPEAPETVSNVEACTEEEKKLFEETGDTLAAELAAMMSEDEKQQEEGSSPAEETIDLEKKLMEAVGMDSKAEPEINEAGAEEKPEEAESEAGPGETEVTEEEKPEEAESEAGPEETEETEVTEKEKPEESEAGPEEAESEETDAEEKARENVEIEEAPADDPEVVQYEAVSTTDNAGKKEKELAMPVYTRKELEEIIRAEGDNPRVIEDEETGITLFDYSDIL